MSLQKSLEVFMKKGGISEALPGNTPGVIARSILEKIPKVFLKKFTKNPSRHS